MKKDIILQLFVIAFSIVIMTATQVPAFEIITEEDFTNNIVTKDILIRTADNFIVLVDASGSMARSYKEGIKKIDAELQILKQQNAILPELGYNAGLYLFTPFETYYEMQPYNREAFRQAIDRLPSEIEGGKYGGPATPLVKGIRELDPILAKLSGKTVVFIFSDGTYSTPASGTLISPVDMARKLVDKYDICFYLISSATKRKAEQLLADIAYLNECSRVVPFNQLYQNPLYGTGALYVVNSRVELKTVSKSKVIGVEASDVLFDWDKVEPRPDSLDNLNKVAEYLQKNPDTFAVFAGYSDNTGNAEYNLKLSRMRAINAKNYVLEQQSIDPDRIILLWYGNANPVASNDTEEGRSKNRRVDIEIGSIVK